MAAPLAATSASSARDPDQTRLADCLYSRDEATCRCPARSPSNELRVELLRWFGWPRAWVVGVRTMASPLRNGERAAAGGRGDNRAARRLGALLLLLRVAALCFSVAAAVFAATSADGVVLRLSAAFRFLLAANAIVAAYSAFEVVAAAWEVARAATLLPEAMQLWFDFGHDQGFGYMALAAAAVATRETAACSGRSSTACLQEDIAVGLGLAAFVFLALAALASGYRLVRFLATGSPHTASSSSPC